MYGKFEDFIVYDLTTFIDSAYNTFALKEKRAIMGHSMGGFGAMKLALKHSDIYSAISSHSGPLDFNHFSDWIPRILSENGGAPVSVYNPVLSKMNTYLFYTMAGAFSPNLSNTSYKVDFPLDSMGNLIDSIWNRWLLHNPTLLAKNLNSNSDLAIYFDCGLQDEYLLHPFNVAFADSMDKLGLTYEFQSFNGGHINQLTNRTPIAFKFIDSVMNKTTGIYKELVIQPESFSLEQNYPNPFNSKTKIQFVITELSFVKLKIYDITGKELTSLVNEEKPTGTYEVTWNAGNLPGGVYFYQLNTDGLIETRKMILRR